MRYRVRVTRVQQAERVIAARNEEVAVTKIQSELEKPYGYFGRWDTVDANIEVVAVESTAPEFGGSVADGSLLLSARDAAEQLGLSRSTMYQLVNGGEIESVRIGRRRLIGREALRRFVDYRSRVSEELP